MDKNYLFEVVKTELSEIFKCNALEFTRDTCAADIELWDSLNNVKMLLQLEKKFKIRFSGIDASSLENVGELVDLIAVKLIPNP
ncbi:acyl carrier protein [Polynucleobacter sp. AP-Kaivos-20-H2]|uniref:acyl carrier protein n=1 Tax=Polynucleobacter sp. AP-Kaivos-20-H2 TaxID=2689104 RepID=UPI001C0C23D6|nr:acyl carrier protein [Polynucleobacter sp. AP-Kaivos-20-H2]MBU3604118.1 acyl carrier protein [Polynucleobacter sp. AP-Kaivos-20-H2]